MRAQATHRLTHRVSRRRRERRRNGTVRVRREVEDACSHVGGGIVVVHAYLERRAAGVVHKRRVHRAHEGACLRVMEGERDRRHREGEAVERHGELGGQRRGGGRRGAAEGARIEERRGREADLLKDTS